MFDHVPHEYEVVARKFPDQQTRVSNVDVTIKKAMHRREVRRVAFDAIDAHAPIPAPVSCRVTFRFVDVGVFAEEMAPFAEANAHVED